MADVLTSGVRRSLRTGPAGVLGGLVPAFDRRRADRRAGRSVFLAPVRPGAPVDVAPPLTGRAHRPAGSTSWLRAAGSTVPTCRQCARAGRLRLASARPHGVPHRLSSTEAPVEPADDTSRRSRRRRRVAEVRADRARPARRRPGTRAADTVAPADVRSPVGCPTGAPTALRGYRMGRWARLAMTTSVVVAGSVLLWTLFAPVSSLRSVPVVVEPGDSLFSIAVEADPVRDADEVVQDIRRINGLGEFAAVTLPVGQVLQVPVSD
ncbi:LysM peptidoglycan-binding domain-containing protein [Nakamurella leprariae]|uniref:LysM peptidoglycan-binding domain-containing protein n=1 Tax=Nakamurella leprariae TaxID=2803911 RepID=A0A939BY55_9ACTN|nr:LysM peptidoglycan-binding domain-containing protein [Nakamurella leprariae]MBM9469223.1 LysM peptidoglycan-binding domain-containing protein [Nakamurella leprariae]